MSSPDLLVPTAQTERIVAMDVIRGVALFGILLMNITGMGLYHAYSDPTVSGGATGWNLIVWWITTTLFEGTMRGLFSMLFGAGVILFTSRKAGDINGVSVTDAYFRRVTWLVLFGMIHAYFLLWFGDILYAYGLVAMFVFSFRHLVPKKLILIAIFAFIGTFLIGLYDYVGTKNMIEDFTEATTKKEAGEELTEEETGAIKAWEGELGEAKPSEEKVKEETEKRHKGYINDVVERKHIPAIMETHVMYRYFFLDVFGMMLIGMAFFKMEIFNATKSTAYYLKMLLFGYLVGLTVNYLETDYIVSNNFDLMSIDLTHLSYDLGRLPTTIGHIGLIMLFVKSGFLPLLQRALAAVGQMALTNYIMHSVITTTLFIGFKTFGTFQRYELYYIVFAIWLFQLITSPIWLKYFKFGPLEWAWRSLTYWKKQSFRR